MRRGSLVICAGMVITILLAGCGNGSFTATLEGTHTPSLSPTTVATLASETSTPSSHPVATNTPPSHSPPPTPTSVPTTKECGLVTATQTASSTTYNPSTPKPLADCLANAFTNCQSAHLAVTFHGSTGTKAYSFGIKQGGCNVVSVIETRFAPDGSITLGPTTFVCVQLSYYAGQLYLLQACGNGESIYFP